MNTTFGTKAMEFYTKIHHFSFKLRKFVLVKNLNYSHFL